MLLLEKHGVPLVNISAIVKAGAAADPSRTRRTGDGHRRLTTERDRRTEARSSFRQTWTIIGGTFEAEAAPDFTVINAEFMTKDLARGLDLFSDALMRPTFPQDETEKFLAQSLDGVKAAKDDPQSVMIPYFLGLPLRNRIRTGTRRAGTKSP